MLPEKDTIDAIFSTVEALTQRQRKNSKSSWPKFKINLTSPPIIFSFLVPGSLLISALGLGVIGNWLGKQEFLLIPKLVLIALMYVSVFLGQIIDLLTDMKNVLIHVIGDAREYAATDAQHVNNFYKDEPQALTYVLVQLKAQKTAWERRVSWFVGPVEKAGLLATIPGLAALIIMARKEGSSSPWIQQMANILVYLTPFLYALGLWCYQQMTKLDRAIMLLEMVIESKKSEHPILEPWHSVSSKNGKKGPSSLCSSFVHTAKPVTKNHG